MRSILLDRDELAWLVRIFEDLVVVEDSRVFWNQSQPGFPRILAQHCFNRFLVVEEFNSDRKSGSVLIPEGRTSKGWELFGSVLHLAFEHFRVGFKDVVAETEVQTGRDSRRRYAEVLAKSLPSLEEPFGVVSGLVARVPRWVRERSAGGYFDKYGLVSASSKQRIVAPAKITHVLMSTATAPAKTTQPPAKFVASYYGSKVSAKPTGKGVWASNLTAHFGDSLEFASLRETLLKFKEEVVVCLERLDSAESAVVGLLGSGPKIKVMDSRHAQFLASSPKCLLKNPWALSSRVEFDPHPRIGLVKGPVGPHGLLVGPSPRIRLFLNKRLHWAWVPVRLFLSPTQKERPLSSILLMPLQARPVCG
jgi:hypothetical protein